MVKINPPEWVSPVSLQNWLIQKEQLSQKIAILEQLAGPHIAWYTHKNPFACWICDYIVLCRRLEELLSIAESSLDFMNDNSSLGLQESRDVV